MNGIQGYRRGGIHRNGSVEGKDAATGHITRTLVGGSGNGVRVRGSKHSRCRRGRAGNKASGRIQVDAGRQSFGLQRGVGEIKLDVLNRLPEADALICEVRVGKGKRRVGENGYFETTLIFLI